MATLLSPRSAAFSAFGCGSLRSVRIRAGGPLRLVAGFDAHGSACRFARRCALRSAGSVPVLRGAGGPHGSWLVPAPIHWPCSRPPGSGLVLATGGLSVGGFATALLRHGLTP